MEARRFCFLYNFCHHAGQRARRIPVYLHRRRRRPVRVIHYSDSNIREKTLLEVLQSPLFIAYHDGQPFNENHLRPCPMLENPELLREMIAKVGGFPFYKHSKTLHRIKGSFTNPQGIYLVEKRTLQNAKSFFLVEEGGFEPPKLEAADLQSVPFGHSGTPPYTELRKRKLIL